MDKVIKRLESNGINRSELEIVSGCARGADTLGERYAREHKIQIIRYPAQWGIYGKRAGVLRNVQMADVADICIVFKSHVDSRGSDHMIRIARSKGLKVVVIEDYETDFKISHLTSHIF